MLSEASSIEPVVDVTRQLQRLRIVSLGASSIERATDDTLTPLQIQIQPVSVGLVGWQKVDSSNEQIYAIDLVINIICFYEVWFL